MQKLASKQAVLNVAVPWSLTHYIPLNGFHPLYRSLFDHLPKSIEVHAWDPVKIYQRLSSDPQCCNNLLAHINQIETTNQDNKKSELEKDYFKFFYPPNQWLTEHLPGEIEFHHTAPYPSLKRPFVFHCESFSPIFIPFAEQGSGDMAKQKALQKHYHQIFSNPLCLGIFSHIPETLENFRRFFTDSNIHQKLFSSKIGLSADAITPACLKKEVSIKEPVFLFINSAHQNSRNFFHRGGHLALAFWKQFKAQNRAGRFIIRCIRPSDADLLQYGVDLDFLKQETNHSILWIEDYLAQHEQNALIMHAHFFLLPSSSLHSVSIMQAMAMGSIPIVTDTIGTEHYLKDGTHGIILKGVRDALWYKDEKTGIMLDRYHQNPELNHSLVSQLIARVTSLLDEPLRFNKMREHAILHAKQTFSGKDFSESYWHDVYQLYQKYTGSGSKIFMPQPEFNPHALDAALSKSRFTQIFESTTQPMRRIFTGNYSVYELGGSYFSIRKEPQMDLHYWSPIAQFFDKNAPKITIENTLIDLNGQYLHQKNDELKVNFKKKIIIYLSTRLIRRPKLYAFGAYVLRQYRRYQAH